MSRRTIQILSAAFGRARSLCSLLIGVVLTALVVSNQPKAPVVAQGPIDVVLGANLDMPYRVAGASGLSSTPLLDHRVHMGCLALVACAVGLFWLHARRSARRFAAQERRQNAMLQAIPDLLFVLDREGVFLEYRGGDRSLLYASPEQFIGKRCEEVLPSELTGPLREAMERSCREGEPVLLEYAIDLDVKRWFEARLSCMGDGRVLVLSHDVTDRRKVLEQAEELHGLRRALDEHTLFSITDRRGRITDINDGFCRISGYSRAELIGQNHRILNSGHHPKSFWTSMWETIAGGRPWRAEVCNRAKDGSLYWVDSTNIPIVGDDGEIRRYISLRFDITERKRLEAENARSMTRYSALFEGSRDAVMVFDRCGVIDCNTATLRMFGVESVEAFRDLHPSDLSPSHQADGSPSREAADAHLERAYREGADRFEWIHKRYDSGESFHVEVLLSALRIDGELVLQAVLRDITERVQARERLTSMYDALTEGVVLMGSDGMILECNPAAERILGIPHDQIVGRTPRDPRWRMIRESGEDLPPDEAPALRTIRSGEPVHGFVHGIVRPDGLTRWLAINCEPIRESDGSVRGAVASIADITVQYEQSKRIEAQQEELNRFFNSSLDMLCIADNDGRFLRLNPEWESCLGYSIREMEGSSFFRFVHPDDVDATREAIYTLMDNAPVTKFENRYRRRDGSYRWIEWRSTPAGDLIYASARDITERKNIEQAMREQQRTLDMHRHELQAILDAIPGYVFYKDDQNTILDLNRAAAESIGLPKDRIRGRATEEFFPAEDARMYLDDDQCVLRSGNAKLGIIESYSTGGETRHIRTDKIPLSHSEGRFDRLVAIATDITEIVESRERANQAQHRLNMALRASNTGLWEWNIQSGETKFSDTWYSMLGYRPEEFPMHISVWERLCHPDDIESAQREIERHFRGDSDVYESEHRLRHKSGGWIWVRGVGEVVERAEDGTPLKAVGVNIDIQQLRESLSHAEAASRAKSEFLANMSHEIRTPMTAILGYADLMTNEDFESLDVRSCARTIQANAGHLLTIINDILDMSKIEAGQMIVESIEVDPLRIVEEVLSVMRPRASAKGIELRVELETAVPCLIRSDPTRLRQILFNLVGNAIKFTEIGSVSVHLKCEPATERLVLRIVDTGVGMTEHQRSLIARFEAFTQADASTTRKFGGTGLGLRISAALAEMLGGGIDVESAPGNGSAFIVTIATGSLQGVERYSTERPKDWRVADAITAHAAATPVATGRALNGLRILLAEDGGDNQVLIGFHLKKAGAHVTVVDNGRRAVEQIELATPQTMPHLILMDMQMPELDGYGATQRLRELGCTVPVIALTAHAMEGDRQKCLAAGCDEYLTKPIDKATLIGVCRRMADASGRHRDALNRGSTTRPSGS